MSCAVARIFAVWSDLSVNLEGSKKVQTHHNVLFVNCVHRNVPGTTRDTVSERAPSLRKFSETSSEAKLSCDFATVVCMLCDYQYPLPLSTRFCMFTQKARK